MLTVSAVDAGLNAIRLAMVAVDEVGGLGRRVQRRYAVRLGADVFASGRISPEKLDAALCAFVDIARRMERAGVRYYRAVATSAARDAENGSELVRLVREECGLELEIISGAEEGRIMRLSLSRVLGSLPSDCLLVDLGGGSMELEHTTEVEGSSLPLGTVRLLQRFPSLSGPISGRELARIERTVVDELLTCVAGRGAAALAIGTGGNLDALARLVPLRGSAVPAIDLTRLRPLLTRLSRTSAEERAKRYGLRSDRADVIVPAGLVMLALAEVYGLRLFAVPGTGIREAILHTLVSETVAPTRARETLLLDSHELAGPERRARIARRLFELLSAVHGLWEPSLAPLEAAAFLAYDADSARRAIAALAGDPELTLAPRARVVAARAVALAFDQPRLAPAPKRDSDRRSAEVLAALLSFANAVTERGSAWEPAVNLMRRTIEIDVGLAAPMPRGVLRALASALGRPVRVS